MRCVLCQKETNKTKHFEIIADKLRFGENKFVYYCKDCDLGILEPINKKDLKQFYKKEYREKYNWIETTEPEKLFERQVDLQSNRIKLIKPYLNKNMRLLEIGCSTGQFLFNVKPYVKEIYGFDWNKESLDYTIKKIECKIMNIATSVDIICMLQVLEHIINPLSYLTRQKQLLNEEGLIYIEVPNLHDALLDIYDITEFRKFYFNQAHLWYFSEKSLLKLMKQCGFEGKIYYTQDYTITNHLNWIYTTKPQRHDIGRKIDISFKKTNGLGRFWMRIDTIYKNLLEKRGFSNSISYIGRKI